jgi:hypothetical protein
MRTPTSWIAGITLLGVLVGCDAGSDTAQGSRYAVTATGGLPASIDAQGSAVCGNFSSQLIVKDRMQQAVTVFNPNEVIAFEILVTNNSNSPQTLNASASCYSATFEVANPNGETIWNNLSAVCFSAQSPRTFAPLETVSYETQWDQQPRSLNPPGASPSALPECRAALRKSATFEIR